MSGSVGPKGRSRTLRVNVSWGSQPRLGCDGGRPSAGREGSRQLPRRRSDSNGTGVNTERRINALRRPFGGGRCPVPGCISTCQITPPPPATDPLRPSRHPITGRRLLDRQRLANLTAQPSRLCRVENDVHPVRRERELDVPERCPIHLKLERPIHHVEFRPESTRGGQDPIRCPTAPRSVSHLTPPLITTQSGFWAAKQLAVPRPRRGSGHRPQPAVGLSTLDASRHIDSDRSIKRVDIRHRLDRQEGDAAVCCSPVLSTELTATAGLRPRRPPAFP